VKVLISEQSIDSLDLVLYPSRARKAAAEVCEGELAADQQSAHDSHERSGPHCVPDHFSIA